MSFSVKFQRKNKISKFVTEHKHPISKDLYEQYSNVRQPSDDTLKEIIKIREKTGAKMSTLVNNYNNDNDKSLRVRDLLNFNHKLNKKLHKSKDQQLEEFFDNLKKDPINTVVTNISEDGILETAFIMLGIQKDWFNMYSEVTHLDGTYQVNFEKYVLFTCLVQV